MKRFLTYFRLQLRRAARLLPRMLAVTLLLAVLTALAALLISGLHAGDEAAAEPVRIGLVGDLEENMLAEGLQMLESMDSSRFSIRFEPMDEAEAASALRRGRIDGYALIPAGFAEAMMRGEHRPITYVSASGSADIGAQMMRELAETIAARRAIVPEDGDRFHVRVKVAVSPQFYGWVTGIGAGIEIVSPAQVREEYKVYLQGIMAKY